MNTFFHNTGVLTKLALKREKLSSTLWIVLITLFVAGLASGMYAALDLPSRIEMATLLENPAMVAMIGPAYVLRDPENYGLLYTGLMYLFTGITVAMMNIFFVIRHTRADEEKGRLEVLRSLPIGRMSNLHAAVSAMVIINLILSVVVGLGLFILGDSSMDLVGSLIWGFGLGAIGIFFGAVAALFSQLSSSSRGAVSYSIVALILFYFTRVPADMAPENTALAFLSPFSLMLRTEVYLSNYIWPLIVLVVFTLVILFFAYYLNKLRDIDQGILPDRAGKTTGGFLLKTPFGLSIRLNKNYVIWTVLGMFLMGASYASILGDIDNFVAHNEMYQTLILGPTGIDLSVLNDLPAEEVVDMMRSVVAHAGFTISTLFTSMINSIMAMMGLAFLIVLILKIKTEEKEGRAELIFATSTSRFKLLGSYLVITLITSVLLQVFLAFGFYSVGAALLPAGELPLQFLLEAALVYLPALWLMIGLTLIFVGYLPKQANLIWVYYGYTFFIMFIGRMGIFPDWVVYTTPFGFIPQLPMDDIQVMPLLLLSLVSLGLFSLGILGYRKRDINVI